MAVLAAAVTVTVPLLLPEVGDIFAQSPLQLTVQLILDVTVNVSASPAAAKLSGSNEMDKAGVGAAACVTLTVRAVTPVPLTVIVAVRGVVAVLEVVVTVIVPLLLPEVGVMVAQAASLFTVQLVLDVI